MTLPPASTDDTIPISAVMLRGKADNIEVLVEVAGDWYLAISEHASNPETISHIAEARGIKTWPKEVVPEKMDDQ